MSKKIKCSECNGGGEKVYGGDVYPCKICKGKGTLSKPVQECVQYNPKCNCKKCSNTRRIIKSSESKVGKCKKCGNVLQVEGCPVCHEEELTKQVEGIEKLQIPEDSWSDYQLIAKKINELVDKFNRLVAA